MKWQTGIGSKSIEGKQSKKSCKAFYSIDFPVRSGEIFCKLALQDAANKKLYSFFWPACSSISVILRRKTVELYV
jgi:hypothetical protein